MEAPLINHVATPPSLSRHRMSLRQSPLKSWARAGRAINTQVAPTPKLSNDPPMTAVLQVSATEEPWVAAPTAPLPTSLFPCWAHTPLALVNTHAAPRLLLSLGPPTMAVLPSPDSPTKLPCRAFPTALLPTSLRSCDQPSPPLLIHTHAAPAPLLSSGPPTIAVLPGPDRATEKPCRARPPIA